MVSTHLEQGRLGVSLDSVGFRRFVMDYLLVFGLTGVQKDSFCWLIYYGLKSRIRKVDKRRLLIGLENMELI